MSDPGNTFLNLGNDPELPAPLRGGVDFTDRLFRSGEGAIARILVRSGGRGGTVWFPPGVYQVETGHTIPATITLAFAPGALLVPITAQTSPDYVSPATVLQIEGPIETEARQIFATEATLQERLPTDWRLGSVVLTGEGTPRVLPEWWGAAREGLPADSVVDMAALQAALRAAVLDRELLTRGARRPPLTLFLGGSYAIHDELLVAADDPDVALPEVVIEGAAMPSLPATLRMVRGDRGSSRTAFPLAMLRFARVQRVRLRGVSFDADGLALHCLRIESRLERDRTDHVVTLDRCAWAHALSSQVGVVDVSAHEPATGSLTVTVSHGTLAFRRAELLPDEAHLRGVLVMLSFQSPYRSLLDVAATRFEGYAKRAVFAAGGKVRLLGCHLAIVDPPDPGSLGAADVELTQAPCAEPRFASLDAVSCVSLSPAFLSVSSAPWRGTDDLPGALPDVARVTLSGVVHRGAQGQGGSPLPSVAWREPPVVALGRFTVTRTPPLGAQLFLFGCRFERPRDDVSVFVPPVPPPPPPPPPSLPLPPVVVSRLPRVFLGPDLEKTFNAATFREDERTDAFGTTRGENPDLVRSLGPGESVVGRPDPIGLYPLSLGDYRRSEPGLTADWNLLNAWADWRRG